MNFNGVEINLIVFCFIKCFWLLGTATSTQPTRERDHTSILVVKDLVYLILIVSNKKLDITS